ncbi:arginine--tRNA ligase [Enterobacteriaceae endosymbiont of Plateumaris braccata]|uniref:arginine--tRNA ligase n=1 Tax=Enterobacteriaceae endosymbiont of Plateumaris braccata TaxID=2675793 RepID=UPI001449E6D2|nr:arginine--tRNA ligase [Enterobacteriaceae endosymbiont of Plateumaris braccata]QJC28379.1 arginine--tRNA ligase [Enterobacteriaceae endosymbiont of Plateumaris braccata]
MNIKKILSKNIQSAMIKSGIPLEYNVMLRKCKKIKFGHYQVNGIISAAIKLNKNPQKLAIKVIQNINLKNVIKNIEISTLGFINIFIKEEWISKQINLLLNTSKLGILKKIKIKNIVIDYSGPNIAKEMHIGHLRSTIIGDSIVRILTFLGHNVIKVNHIGDWGTQFGMLIAFLKFKQQNKKNIVLSDLDQFYKKAQIKYNNDVMFAEKSRKYVVKLQNNDPFCLKIWKKFVQITMNHNYFLYKKLDVLLSSKDTFGESTYNYMLPKIILDLKKKGLAINSNGTTVIPIKKIQNKNNNTMAIVIQKKDGAYLYATTDIACIKYRCKILKADRIIYYVDARQNQYLKQIFLIAKKANYAPLYVKLEHHMFGMILDHNNKPFKTRTGKNIKLSLLIEESIIRSKKVILKKNPMIKDNELENLSAIIGISAIKYSELSKNRITNYVFNWDDMLSLNGNTAPYIQYAYVRAKSILIKSKIDFNKFSNFEINFSNNYEINLAITFLEFEEIIFKVIKDGTPHILCNWLYKITTLFSHFYENCNILNIQNDLIKTSRLKIVFTTTKFLKTGLNLLGIKTINKM